MQGQAWLVVYFKSCSDDGTLAVKHVQPRWPERSLLNQQGGACRGGYWTGVGLWRGWGEGGKERRQGVGSRRRLGLNRWRQCNCRLTAKGREWR